MEHIQNIEKSIDISVIIPVFNPPIMQFEAMIESVINQTADNYEVILVDDGSDEATKREIQVISSRYPCVRVVSQENKGVSAARNVGIAESRGQYITFIDADDYIDKDFLRESYWEIEKRKADALFGQICITDLANKSSNIELGGTVFLDGKDIYFAKRSLLGYVSEELPYRISGSPCGNLYKKSLIQDIKFNTTVKYFEDQLFNREVLNRAKSVIVSSKTWYFYLNNIDSAMHHVSVDKELLVHLNALLDDLYKLNSQEDAKVKNVSKNYMIHLWWGILTLTYRKTGYDKSDTRTIMKKISNHILYREIFTAGDFIFINSKDRLMLEAAKRIPVVLLVDLLKIFKKV